MFFPEIEPEAFGFSNINETEVDAYYPEVDVFLFLFNFFFFVISIFSLVCISFGLCLWYNSLLYEKCPDALRWFLGKFFFL